jgi:drug/metabolite transporter (DMT)-like permease
MKQNFSTSTATLIGSCGLLLWSTTAFMAIHVTEMPTFEFLFMMLFVTLICTLFRLTWNKKWAALSKSPKCWIIGSVCIPINALGYYCAFKFISPAQADLIYYLYPIGGLLLAGIVFKNRIPKAAFAGAFLGFLGVFILFYDDVLSILSPDNLKGISFAGLAALSWSIYMINSRLFSDTPHEMVGLFFGIGAIFYLIIHLMTESFVLPTLEELFYILLWGIVIQSYSYSLWEIGIKKGNFIMMNIMSYMIPLCSILILIASGNYPLTLQVLLATLFVIAGMAICPREAAPSTPDCDPNPR